MAVAVIVGLIGALGGGLAYYELVYAPAAKKAATHVLGETTIDATLIVAATADTAVPGTATVTAANSDPAANSAAGYVASQPIPASAASAAVVVAVPIVNNQHLVWSTGGVTKALDCAGGACKQGTPVQSWSLNSNPGQQWTFVKDATNPTQGTLQSGGTCLDVPNGVSTAGTQVQAWPCNQTGAQTWQWSQKGSQASSSSLLNPQSGRCLDVNGVNSADGTKVQLWDCLGNDAQTWGPAA